jgi:hypothetical protein
MYAFFTDTAIEAGFVSENVTVLVPRTTPDVAPVIVTVETPEVPSASTLMYEGVATPGAETDKTRTGVATVDVSEVLVARYPGPARVTTKPSLAEDVAFFCKILIVADAADIDADFEAATVASEAGSVSAVQYPDTRRVDALASLDVLSAVTVIVHVNGVMSTPPPWFVV